MQAPLLPPGERAWSNDTRCVRLGEVGSHTDEMPEAIVQAFMAEAGTTLREPWYA